MLRFAASALLGLSMLLPTAAIAQTRNDACTGVPDRPGLRKYSMPYLPGGVNVRAGAGTNHRILYTTGQTASAYNVVQNVFTEATGTDGQVWVSLNYVPAETARTNRRGGVSGWVRSDFIREQCVFVSR